jgi:methyl-accepting chemotaxis protein
MSIRLKILLPMILIALGALLLSGAQMWRSAARNAEVADIAARAIRASELAHDVRFAFDQLSELVGEVTAMTHFIGADVIKARYDKGVGLVAGGLSEMKAQARSPEMAKVGVDAIANFEAWRDDAAVALGVRAAAKVPMADTLKRKHEAVKADLDQALALSGRDSRRGIADVRAQQSAETKIALAFATLLGLAAMVGAWIVAGGLARPIRALVASADRLAKGDVSVTFEATARRDEIGDIARAVAAFRDNVTAAQQAEAAATEGRKAAELQRRRNEAEAAKSNAEQTRVVDALSQGLERLARGDLTYRVEGEFGAAYARLKTDFNKSLDVLREALAAISEGASDVQANSSEIAGLAADLSTRTGSQTASIEQAAAALEEITMTVKLTADNAGQARGVVSKTREEAEKSGALARSAVDSIGRIQQSALEIENIIGVIDEIAFQTNLLALNAGVEAARAGEFGRGFAVVATEVRALAQRSADASREIKTLISSSSAQVKEGVDLVVAAGSALDRIAAQVGEIDRVVGNIASGAAEQSTGVQSVNEVVSEIDRMNQSNADIVERTTTACADVAGRAADLAGAVARFQVKRGEEGQPRRRAA